MESELSVTDVLTTDYVGVSESDTVRGAVQLMRDERASCVLVVRGADAVGIMTEWDLLDLVADEREPSELTVGDVMTTPVISVAPDRSLTDAASLMTRENIRNVVVEDEEGVRGVVTQRDVIAAASSFQATVAPRSRSSSDGAVPGPGPGSEPGQRPEDPAAQSTAAEADDRALANGGDEYTTQGVCEACGSLAESLQESNGQLVCPDCRAV
ncbi:CBS domain-containing protein [Halopiger aswanensis]|uniref:CBS domain protein n=1 Tax=Halopiger aswanensis TaxID=148449 RepID=A0A419WPC8_9EURY|nr:CBS domain-containing protein [Halopiger aswanensis]RKD97264.1 CBS domain protein [Halopiger aswanensis]